MNKIKIEPLDADGSKITNVIRPGKTIKIGAEIDPQDFPHVKAFFKEAKQAAKEKKPKEVHDADTSNNS